MSKMVKGNIPLVSAKKFDNGYKDFVKDNGKEVYPQNILTLNNDGDGGAGISYYQPSKMMLDTHVTALIPRFSNANKYVLLFFSCCITKQREKFGHGYSLNNGRINSFRITLPIKENGDIYYEYMEMFVKISIQKMYEKYFQFFKNNMIGVDD